MELISSIFWNSVQRRPRALWRLMGQLVIFAVLALIIEGMVGVIAFSVLLAREGIPPDQLSDPQIAQGIIVGEPTVMMFMSLGLVPALTISIWLAGRFLDRRSFADFGFHLNRDWWIDFSFGLGLGAFLMLLIFLIELASGWVTVTDTFVTRSPDASFVPALLVPLVSFVAVGFYEELFSRGYQLLNLAEGLNWRRIGAAGAIVLATLLSSALFGALHATNPNASLGSTLNITLAGVLLAAGYLLTGELAIPIGLHITWNFFQGNVFGFPVSGVDFRSASFVSVRQQGPRLWTGGPFGPEAGLLGVGAMLLGILLTVLWVRWRYDQIGLELSLAEVPSRTQPAT